jgi:hypothetical protein
MRWLAGLIGVVVALALGGCEPDLGECDNAAAREVVYNECGNPAYLGQALVQNSCGHGGYCHSRLATGLARRGAPLELNWDSHLASLDGNINPYSLDTLRQGQLNLFENRQLVWTMVEGGAMPPMDGDATDGVFDRSDRPFFHRAGGGAVVGLDMEQERDHLRNWLACGSPLIERTRLPTGMDDYRLTVGIQIPAQDPLPDPLPVKCQVPEPNFPSIYRVVIEPSCGGASACHNAMSGLLDQHHLDMSTREMAYMNLVGVTAMGEDTAGPICASSGLRRVVPGAPEMSLLYLKVTSPPCGMPMPLGGTPLPMETTEVIREWIANGAHPEM